jgi:hypothetical protein
MPHQTKVLFPLNRGVHYGFPAHRLPDGFSPRQVNIRIRDGTITKRPGTSAYIDTWQVTADAADPAGGDGTASVAAGTITGAFFYIQENGTQDTLVMTGGSTLAERRIYRQETTKWGTLGDGDITNGAGGDDLLGSATDAWDATMAPNASQNDVFYACNGHGSASNFALLKYTGSGNATALPISGLTMPAIPKYLATFANRLIMANTFAGAENRHNRIYWSKYGDAEEFNDASGTSGSAELIETSDMITRLLTLRGALVIYKESSIYVATETGFPTIPLQFSLVSRDIGTRYGFSVASAGDRHFFLGPDNVYIFDGASLSPIGDPIRSHIRNINPAASRQCFGVVDFTASEYWLFVAEGADLYPRAAWVYNWREQHWTRWEFPFLITAAGRVVLSTSPTWDDLTSGGTEQTGHPLYEKTWAEVPDNVTWASLLVSGTYSHAVANSDKTMEQISSGNSNDGTSAIAALWESRDVDFMGDPAVVSPHQNKILTRVRAYCRGTGTSNTLTCAVSTDGGASYISSDSQTVPTTGGYVAFDTWLTADRFRIRLSNSIAGESMPQIEELTLFYAPADSR